MANFCPDCKVDIIEGDHRDGCPRARIEFNPSLKVHEGGATSSYLGEVRFDLVPTAGIEAAARRAAFGAKRHGEWNWRKSITRDFAIERLNHLNKHLLEFNEFFRQEDLDAIIFNAMMIAEFKKSGVLPEMGYNAGKREQVVGHTVEVKTDAKKREEL